MRLLEHFFPHRTSEKKHFGKFFHRPTVFPAPSILHLFSFFHPPPRLLSVVLFTFFPTRRTHYAPFLSQRHIVENFWLANFPNLLDFFAFNAPWKLFTVNFCRYLIFLLSPLETLTKDRVLLLLSITFTQREECGKDESYSISTFFRRSYNCARESHSISSSSSMKSSGVWSPKSKCS